MRVIVIGGVGNFGARICRRLAQEAGFEIVATGRQANAASPASGVETAILDIGHAEFESALQALSPDVVIHCAGPFQSQDYRVALAAVRCGAHYIDLADGRDFVGGFNAALQAAADAAGRLAITGASTLPALSSAVVDSMQEPAKNLRSINIVIAPGQQAPRGIATMSAVLGYAGSTFPWRQEGVWRTAHGWQELKRERFSFGSRLAAACDVPDLSLLPDRYPGVLTVTFRAALEVSVQHIALWVLAGLRRVGVPISIAHWARSLNRAGTWLDRFGSGTGGMKVRIEDSDSAGRLQKREWELVAKDNHGPEIPCMAAVLLALKLARGDELGTGAKVCMGTLTLSDFETEFARWNITTQVHEIAA